MRALLSRLARWWRGDAEEIEYFRYVAWENIPDAILDGWVIDRVCPGHHGEYAILMRWGGDGAPVGTERRG